MVQNYKTRLQKPSSGRGSIVAKVSDRGWLVTNSSRVIQNISRVGKRCTLKMSRAQTFSRWCGVLLRMRESYINVAVYNKTRTIGDGPRNDELQSNDEDGT
ncbi:hypothetical protein TNCV_2916021 [Trichonephila clavipes]|nr:hypothetical protein TNCV_2916021 [Trichonephila clavipes]